LNRDIDQDRIPIFSSKSTYDKIVRPAHTDRFLLSIWVFEGFLTILKQKRKELHIRAGTRETEVHVIFEVQSIPAHQSASLILSEKLCLHLLEHDQALLLHDTQLIKQHME